jgi:probable O-glycosylation ligase (exosortase A-associated)
MRDIVIALIVFGSLPLILARPFAGVVMFAWLGYMNPHKLSFGFAYDFPFAQIVALTTLAALLLSNESKRFPINRLTMVWFLFIVWMGITTAFAFYPEAAWLQYQKVLKIQLMSFVIILLVTSEERLRVLIWTIVLSIGYYGVKGGVFTLMTGGVHRIWGPEGTFIGGNNEIALALLMVLPLMYYLRSTSSSRLVRHGLLGAMVLCALSVAGSQSRGALLGGVAMVVFLWIKSKHKVLTGLALLVVLPALILFMPQQWHDRMNTIENYELDSSATQRIQTWKMALNLANHNVPGGGFELWTEQTYRRYSTDPPQSHDGHSIYFKVLGEHGWMGLSLFLLIGFLTWRAGSTIVRDTRIDAAGGHLGDFARMVHVSIATFAVAGAFLGLSYFDLYWNLVAMVVAAHSLVQKRALAESKAAGRIAFDIDQVPFPR